MRILGLDLGTKTLGLAITDRSNTIASSYKVLRFQEQRELIPLLSEIITTEKITTLVLGLPKNMDNSLGYASTRSLEFKKLLEENFSIEVVLVDERLSTMEAERYLLDVDMKRKNRKKVIDSLAASIILETYLRGRK